ncbi:MAG: hypothetical protein MMC23_000602 [Stictis urceolatum]|nr:hypothetical protein [Stictis urceolata]
MLRYKLWQLNRRQCPCEPGGQPPPPPQPSQLPPAANPTPVTPRPQPRPGGETGNSQAGVTVNTTFQSRTLPLAITFAIVTGVVLLILLIYAVQKHQKHEREKEKKFIRRFYHPKRVFERWNQHRPDPYETGHYQGGSPPDFPRRPRPNFDPNYYGVDPDRGGYDPHLPSPKRAYMGPRNFGGPGIDPFHMSPLRSPRLRPDGNALPMRDRPRGRGHSDPWERASMSRRDPLWRHNMHRGES